MPERNSRDHQYYEKRNHVKIAKNQCSKSELDDGIVSPISASVLPTMGALTDTDTPADGYVAGTYTSSEGTISSAVPTYYVNDNVELGTYDLQPGDVVYASVLVTDSAANTRTYTTNSSTVPTVGVWILDTGSWNDAGIWDDTDVWKDA